MSNYNFRRLGFQDLSLAKQFDKWTERNDISMVSSLIQSKSMDVFLIMNEDGPVGIFNVTYKVTALGKTIAPLSVHIHDLYTLTALTEDVVQAVGAALGKLVNSAYKLVVVSYPEESENKLTWFENAGFNTHLGSIAYQTECLGLRKHIILMGNIQSIIEQCRR